MKRILFWLFMAAMIFYFGCSEDSSTESVNSAPEIQKISANPSVVKINETISLSCEAADAGIRPYMHYNGLSVRCLKD